MSNCSLEDEGGCIYTPSGCEIFQKLNKAKDLELLNEVDGAEYEIWQNKITKQKFKVPTKVVRDFENMELLD